MITARTAREWPAPKSLQEICQEHEQKKKMQMHYMYAAYIYILVGGLEHFLFFHSVGNNHPN